MISSFSGRNRFLSNFYPARVRLDSATYPTVEHAYQAAKALDLGWRQIVRLAPTAGIAKRYGRQLPLREDWELVKLDVMLDLLRQKFSAEPLAAMLIGTGDRVLVEGNVWHDNFWGSCRCLRCGDRGDNQLGKLLMQTREELLAARKMEAR